MTAAKVWILTEEVNTGDSEHDTTIEGVFATEASANAALEKAVRAAIDSGKCVHGWNWESDDREFDENDDFADWDLWYGVEAFEVQS